MKRNKLLSPPHRLSRLCKWCATFIGYTEKFTTAISATYSEPFELQTWARSIRTFNCLAFTCGGNPKKKPHNLPAYLLPTCSFSSSLPVGLSLKMQMSSGNCGRFGGEWKKKEKKKTKGARNWEVASVQVSSKNKWRVRGEWRGGSTRRTSYGWTHQASREIYTKSLPWQLVSFLPNTLTSGEISWLSKKNCS